MADSRCRSVNDYETAAELRNALTSSRGIIGCSQRNGLGACTTEEKEDLDWMLYNYDKDNSIPQNIDYELKRLQVLKSYHVLDAFAEEEASFARITNLAGRMFDMPIAVVTLVDMGRQYFVSTRGLGDLKEMPRSISFCTHAILSYDDVFIVKDASKDPRFVNNPLITGPAHLRFYAGAPLLSPEGFKLGTLCILDTKPRPAGLTLEEKQNLRELSAVVVENLVDRRSCRRRAMGQGMATTAHDLLAPITSMQQNLLRALADKDNNRDLLVTFLRCSEIMSRICHKAIFDENSPSSSSSLDTADGSEQPSSASSIPSSLLLQDFQASSSTAKIERLVEDIESVVSPFPKRVPVQIDLDPKLHNTEVFLGDDLKVARSAINLLVHACDRADRGQVTLRVFSKTTLVANQQGEQELLVFEVEDNGPVVPVECYPTLFQPALLRRRASINRGGEEQQDTSNSCVDRASVLSELSLLSVASNIDSLDGDYGFYAKDDGALMGSVFWFAIPMKQRAVQTEAHKEDDGVVDPFVFQKSEVQLDRDGDEEEEPVFASPQDEAAAAAAQAQAHLQPKRYRGLGHHTSQDPSQLVTRETDAAIQHAEPPISLPMGVNDYDPYAVRDDMMQNFKQHAPHHRRQSGRRTSQSGEHHDAYAQERGQDQKGDGNYYKENATSDHSHPKVPSSGVDTASPYGDPSLASISMPSVEDMKAQMEVARAARANRTRGGGASGRPGSDYPHSHAALARTQGNHRQAATGGRERRALVIDDSITVRKSMDRALTRLGYDVVQASNGMQGLKELRASAATPFDVTFVDFLMPVVDGIDCVQQFRQWESENRPECRQYIVGVSAHGSDPAIVQQGLEAGMDRFVPKPITSVVVKEVHDSEELRKASEAIDAYLRKDENSDGGEDESERAETPTVERSVTPTTTTPPETVVMVADEPALTTVRESNHHNSLPPTHHIPAEDPLEDPVVEAPQRPAGGVFRRRSSKSANHASTAPETSSSNRWKQVHPAVVQDPATASQKTTSGPPCCLIGVSSRPAAVALFRCVEARGWKASTVEDGADALRLLKMRAWDLVFLDDLLPRMSGAACIANFREWESRQGRDGSGDRQSHLYLLNERFSSSSAVMPAGADGVLGKPIKTKELTRILDNANSGRGGPGTKTPTTQKRPSVRGMMKRMIHRK